MVLSGSGRWQIPVQTNFEIQYRHVTDGLDDAGQRQVPFLLAKTLTAVGQDVREHFTKRMPVVFDRPTPFTQRGVFLKRADKKDLNADVYFPDSQEQSGRAQREYIRPGARGGRRHQKRTEFLLTGTGYLPPGWVTVPGSYFKGGEKLDQYGNIPGAIYKQIINLLQIKKFDTANARKTYAASQKRVAKMGTVDEFFAVGRGANTLNKGGGWLPPGVYRRTGPGGRKLVQYLLFVPKAKYDVRLDVGREAEAAVRANLPRRWKESVQALVDRFPAK